MKRGGIPAPFFLASAYNPDSMIRRAQVAVSLLLFAAILSTRNSSSATTQVKDLERQIFARARVFPEIGPGVSALKRDAAAGRYYILAAPANSIVIYDPDGKRAGQIPNANSATSKIVFAQDFDLDEAGRILVADRGAGAVKIFLPDGPLAAAIPVAAPTSIVALPDAQFAVTSLGSRRLITLFDEHGLLIRSFGDHIDLTEHADINLLLNRGRISGDSAGHIYFAFTYLPNPTIRKYDSFGYAAYVLSLTAGEFDMSSHDQRKNIFGIERNNNAVSVKPVIGAVGVDAATQQVWAALGDSLVHFDKDGNRLLTYRTTTKEGVRIEPIAILVEPDRLILADDPIGIFDFARPDKQAPELPQP
jgi:hypothetical protein